MPNPVFVQFVQVSHGAIHSAAVTIERVFQYPPHQFDDFPQNPGCVSVVAPATEHCLKAGRQKTLIPGFKPFCTGGTDKQIREDTRQPQHPDFEVTGSEFDRTSLLQSSSGHAYQPENRILRFVLRKKSIDQLDQAPGANGPIVVLE